MNATISSVVMHILLGAFLGGLHGIILLSTTDYGSLLLSLAVFNDEHSLAYLAVYIGDLITVVFIIASEKLDPFIDTLYKERINLHR